MKRFYTSFVLLGLLLLTVKSIAQPAAALTVTVTQLRNGWDCGNDAWAVGCGNWWWVLGCDDPEPRWKARAGYNGANFSSWRTWNAGTRTCDIWDIADVNLLNNVNVGTASTFNFDAETWEEDGIGGISAGCAYFACGDNNFDNNFNPDCCTNFCGWFSICFDGDDAHWGPGRLADFNFRAESQPCTIKDWGWFFTQNNYAFKLQSYYTIIDPPTFTTNLTSTYTVCPGVPLSFTGTANTSNGVEAYYYQWEYSINGTTWIRTGMPASKTYSFVSSNSGSTTQTVYYRLLATTNCTAVYAAPNMAISGIITVNTLAPNDAQCNLPTCNTVYVDPVNGNDGNTLPRPSTAYKTLWKALSSIPVNNSTLTHIKLAAGTTAEPTNTPIIMQSNVIVEGGYVAGSGGAEWKKSSDPNDKTIITGNYQYTGSTIPKGVYGIIAGYTSGFATNNITNWRLQDLYIRTSNGVVTTYPGTCGVYINGTSNYDIVRCDITPGTAASGGSAYGIYANAPGAGNITDCRISAGTYAMGQSGGTAPTINLTQSGGTLTVNSTTNTGGALNNPTNTELVAGGTIRSNIPGKYCINSEIDLSKAGSTWSAFPQSTAGVGSLELVQDLKPGSTSFGTSSSPIKVTTTSSGAFNIGYTNGTLTKFLTVAPSTEFNRTWPVIAASPASICVGGSANLSITSGSFDDATPPQTNIKEREWLVYLDPASGGSPTSPLFAISGQFTTAPSVGPFNTAGTYIVRYRERHQCCGWSKPSFTTITVVLDPTAPVITRDPVVANVCYGTPVRASIVFPSDGVGCNNVREFSIDYGPWQAYTNNTYVGTTGTSGINANTSIRIRGTRDCSSGNGCTPFVFAEEEWIVTPQPQIFAQPQPITVCNGTPAQMSLTVINGVDVQYQWQYNATSCGSAFSDIGTLSPNNSVGLSTTTNGITYYRAIISSAAGSGCSTLTSNCASLTVNPHPTSGPVTRNPNMDYVCEGKDLSASSSGGSDGVGCSDIQEYRFDGVDPWIPYTSGTIPTAGHTQVEVRNYRGNCDSIAGCISATPNVVTWSVVPPPISGTLSKSPNVLSVCSGATVSASLASPGTNGVGCSDVVEYRTKIGGVWTSWTTGTSVTTNAFITDVEMRTYRGSCTVNAGCPADTSAAVAWVVLPQPTLSDPAVSNSGFLCSSTGSISISSTLSGGTANNTPRWEYFNGSTWSKVTNGVPTGAVYTDTTGTITISGITGTGSFQYRYVLPVNDFSCGTIISDTCKITIAAPFSAGAINGGSQTRCYNSASNLVVSQNSSPSVANVNYLWYQIAGAPSCPTVGTDAATLAAAGWTSMPSATSGTLNLPGLSLTTTTTYLLTVDPTTFPDCNGYVSAQNCYTVNVLPQFDRGNVNNTYTICSGSQPSPLNFTTLPSGGDGSSYSYTWYYKDAVATPTANTTPLADGWTAASSLGTTSGSTFTPSGAQSVANRTYICWVDYTGTPDCGAADYAAGRFLITTASATAPATPAPITTCDASGDNVPNLVMDPPGLPSGASNLAYLWRYVKSNAAACNAITFSGALTFTSGELNPATNVNADPTINVPSAATWTFIRRTSVTCGSPSTYYTCVKVTASPFGGGTLASTAQTICNGAQPANITYSTAPSGSASLQYQWYYQAGSIAAPSGNFSQGAWQPVGTAGTSPTLNGSTIGALTTTTTFALRVRDLSSVACFDRWAGNVHVVTVRDAFTSGSLANASQSICNNSQPQNIGYSTTPAGGSSLQYQWYKQNGTPSCPSGPFSIGSWTAVGSPINSPAAPTLTGAIIGNISTPTTFALRVTDVGTPACFDNWAGNCHLVDILPAFNAGAIDNGVMYACATDPAPIAEQTPPAGGVAYLFQWYYRDGDFSASCPTGTNLTGWTAISGANSANYDPPSTTGIRTYARTVRTNGTPSCNPTETWSGSCRVVYPNSIDPNNVTVLATTTSQATININDNKWHYFSNPACELIAAVNSGGLNLGNVTMKVYKDSVKYTFPNGGYGREQSCLGKAELAMGRYYEMTTENTPGSGTTQVRLFYNVNDFNSYMSAINALPYVNMYEICYGYPSGPAELAVSRNTLADMAIDNTTTLPTSPIIIYKEFGLSPSLLRVGSTEATSAGPTSYHFHTNGGIGGPLPVELISFVGWSDGEFNQLQWITASEENSARFVVEKSSNATNNWVAIGEVQAAGNSVTERTYGFTDVNPVIGNNYYRLRMIDIGGSFEYSNVINIPLSAAPRNAFVGIYPNPTDGLLNIQIQSTGNFNTQLKVFDVLGQEVSAKPVAIVKGLNQFQINYKDLAKATYVLSYTDNNGTQYQVKFVKE